MAQGGAPLCPAAGGLGTWADTFWAFQADSWFNNSPQPPRSQPPHSKKPPFFLFFCITSSREWLQSPAVAFFVTLQPSEAKPLRFAVIGL